MEVVSFIDPQGNKLYCIGPFRERSHASRAAAALPRISAQGRERPKGAITARAWAIFDLLGSDQPRAALLQECERQGINKGTAATQYQKWRKASAAA
jgi:hypothetical protein